MAAGPSDLTPHIEQLERTIDKDLTTDMERDPFASKYFVHIRSLTKDQVEILRPRYLEAGWAKVDYKPWESQGFGGSDGPYIVLHRKTQEHASEKVIQPPGQAKPPEKALPPGFRSQAELTEAYYKK